MSDAMVPGAGRDGDHRQHPVVRRGAAGPEVAVDELWFDVRR